MFLILVIVVQYYELIHWLLQFKVTCTTYLTVLPITKIAVNFAMNRLCCK